jgi:hypothetical protein
MANKTRAEYRQAVRDNLDDQTQQTWTDDYLNNKIEEARQDICNRYYYNFLEAYLSTSTTTATNVVGLPPDYNKMLSVTWSDGISTRPLSFCLDEEWETLNYTSATIGTPYKYTIFGGQVKIYPRQQGILREKYKKLPVEFNDENTPDNVIPRRWGHIVEDWATAVAWEKDEELDNANQYWNKVEQKIKLMKQEEGEKQMQEAVRQGQKDEFLAEADPRRIGTLT